MKRLLTLLLAAMAVVMNAAAENYPYRSDMLWVTVPDHADWLYDKGEKAKVEVQLYRYGVPLDCTVTYETADDMMPADGKGEAKLRGGRAVIDMGTRPTPGFRDLRLKAVVGGKTYKHHIKVGYSVGDIRPSAKEPADFTAFWSKGIEEMRAFPLTYTKEKADEYCTDKIDCYLVKLTLNKQRQAVYAYLFYPKGAQPGRHPVVLCPPGAGIKTIKEPLRHKYYAENGCIRMEMEIHGIDPRLPKSAFDDISRAFNSKENGYLMNGLDSPSRYYMRRVYLSLVRCIDLLTSLPEWDGRNVIVQGGSQGGALAIVAAALDSRVTQCIVNHPALADMAAPADTPPEPRQRTADQRRNPHPGLLRRGELRPARHRRHIHDVGIQRRHLPANHVIRRMEHPHVPQGLAHHAHKRALDVRRDGTRADGVDVVTPEVKFLGVKE